MHTLIVCGTPWCDLPSLFKQLAVAGVAPARPAQTGSIATMEDWHQRLFAHQPTPTRPVNPGKAWEQAAGEIFLANWDQALWGWADARSTWLLDFWHQFDAQTRFLLVHTPAADALVAAAQHTQGPAFDAVQVLNTWCAHQAQLLEFYLRHPDRCTWWVHAHAQPDLAQDATHVLQWPDPAQLALHMPWPRKPANPTLALLRTLALQAVHQHEQAAALQSEVWATLPGLDAAAPLAFAPQAPAQDAASLLSQVRQALVVQVEALNEQLHTQTRAHQALAEQHAQALAELQHQQIAQAQNMAAAQELLGAESSAKAGAQAALAAESKAKASLQSKLEAETQAKADTQAKLNAESKAKAELQSKLDAANQAQAALQQQLDAAHKAQSEATEESELLLLQLHQVQEELESVFLRAADQDKQLAAAHALKADLQSTLDAATQAQAALQQQLQAAHKTQAEATEESELLLAQLHQVQEELESVFLRAVDQDKQLDAAHALKADLQSKLEAEAQAKADAQAKLNAEFNANADLQSRLDAATQAQAALQQQLDAEGTAKADAQARLSAKSNAKADLQSKLEAATQAQTALQLQLEAVHKTQAEATEESELLLAQLHQVQEELEHYFLQHQQAEHARQQLQERLARWAQRYPDHCEWDSLAVLPHTKAQQQELLITHLQHGGRELAQLHVHLHHTKKHPQLVLQHTAGQTAPLQRWPSVAGAQEGQTAPAPQLVLQPSAPAGTPEAAALAALAPSDLQLIKAVCKNVAAQLPASVPDAAAWASRWQAMADSIDQLPPAWRFDALRLRHEQVNPDYEHLWLHFDHAQYGSHHWPVFEFRLSANNVRKGKWSHLPKLEFPLPDHNGPKPFENWFDESEDDKGPKFELRFDMKTPAMDMACWKALSPADQDLALALVRSLHGLLQQLEQAGTAIHRPWADWHAMATGIQYALAACLQLDPQAIGYEAPTATPV